MNEGFEAMTGVKVVSLVFAFVGAALGISYTPEISKRSAMAALIAGVTCGALGPEAVAWGFSKPLPLIANNALAVVFGIGGMFIVPGVIRLWTGFRDDPFGWLDRWRGKGDAKGGGQ